MVWGFNEAQVYARIGNKSSWKSYAKCIMGKFKEESICKKSAYVAG